MNIMYAYIKFKMLKNLLNELRCKNSLILIYPKLEF